jgi:hypothetical protein
MLNSVFLCPLLLLLPPVLLPLLLLLPSLQLPGENQGAEHALHHIFDDQHCLVCLLLLPPPLLLLPGQPQGSHPAHLQALLRADGAAAAEAQHTRHKRARQAAQGEAAVFNLAGLTGNIHNIT